MTSNGAPSPEKPTRWWLNGKAVVGILLGVGLLYFALRGVDAGEVLSEIRHADPLLFAAAVFAATVLFAVRAIRWGVLIQPFRPDSAFRPRFAATNIGFMANNLLPARIGEFARAFALSRMERVPVTASFGSLVVERLLDGLTLFAFLFLAMAMPGFPGMGRVAGVDLDSAALLILAFIAGIILVLLAMVLWPARTVALFEAVIARVLPRSFRRPLIDALEAFLSGIRVIREPMLLFRAAMWSVLVWGLGALSFWLGFLAFDIDVPISAALFLQSFVAMAVSLPSAPGFFGLFEAGVRIGLVDIFGVEVNKAMGFAVGFHIGGFIPVTLIGLYYAWRLGMTWKDVGRSEEVVERAVETGDGVGTAP